MNRIAIIGAGYIGGALIAPLKQKGFVVRASTTTSEKVMRLKDFADEVFVLKGDEEGKMHQFLRDCKAAIVTVAPKEGADYQTTYLRTADSLAASNAHLESVIYTSSTSVYGNHEGRWVDEDTPPLPETPQSRILLETESVLQTKLPAEVKLCIFRLGGIYGSGRELADRMKRFAGKVIPGSGLSYTNLVHREDVASSILFALDNALKGVFNLVNDTRITRRELYSQLASDHRLPEVLWDDKQYHPHSGNKRVSNAKIKDAGFTFLHPNVLSNHIF